MILTTGTAIRFKGESSDRMANEFADSLRGHCAIHGSKIVITKRTEVQIVMRNGSAPARTTPVVCDLSLYRNGNE
jgi:hypothetical protein